MIRLASGQTLLVAHNVDINHGDTIQMGRIRMKFMCEAREPDPKTQILDAD